MVARVLRTALPAILASTFGLQLAHADIYTWVDASGATNVSNLAPPEGVRVTKILRASAPEIVAREYAARDAARQAETQALADRVRQLEAEVDMAGREMPPPMDYRPVPAPPVIQYVVDPAPQFVQYVNVGPPAYNGCDPAWMGCALWWSPGIYPASVFVVRTPGSRPTHPVRGGHNFVAQPPMRPFGPWQGQNISVQQPMRPFASSQGPKHG